MRAYDPLARESKLRAHEIFAELRETCPVHRHPMPPEEVARHEANPMVTAPTTEFWSVLRYDDCVAVLQRPEIFSNLEGPGPERRVMLSKEGMLLGADDPAHRRQRQIANKGFAPRVVDTHVPVIRQTIDDLVDEVGPQGRADVMADFAIPLTVAMITALFGAGGDRRADVARWGLAIVAALGGEPEAAAAGRAAMQEQFTRGEVAKRRAALARGETLPADVLSSLIVAEHEGSRFDDDEISTAAMQFLTAGFETTATAIGSAVVLLCTHPAQRAKLEADWSLLDSAVEEVLRFESPVEGTFRTATSPTRVGDEDLPAGAKVRVVYASANRDAARFPDPDSFRIDRPTAELRRHLAFGNGTHACIGSALARAELRAAVQTLLRRLPGLALDPEDPPRRNLSLTINGFTAVPVRWDPARVLPR